MHEVDLWIQVRNASYADTARGNLATHAPSPSQRRNPRAVVVKSASSLRQVNLLGDVLLVEFLNVDVLERHHAHRAHKP